MQKFFFFFFLILSVQKNTILESDKLINTRHYNLLSMCYLMCICVNENVCVCIIYVMVLAIIYEMLFLVKYVVGIT